MSFDAIRASAEQIMSGWATIPVAYDNVAFTPPTATGWARITVLDGDSFNKSLGDGCIRRTGIVQIQVFTPQWLGTATARGYADELDVLFSNIRSGGVVYYASYVTRVGHDNDIYQLNVSIPFSYDEA